MEYATMNMVGADCAKLPEAYLDRISGMAADAERSASHIDAFIDRCRGGGATSSNIAPVPSGHFGQLSRLQDALDEIDRLARELQTIG